MSNGGLCRVFQELGEDGNCHLVCHRMFWNLLHQQRLGILSSQQATPVVNNRTHGQGTKETIVLSSFWSLLLKPTVKIPASGVCPVYQMLFVDVQGRVSFRACACANDLKRDQGIGFKVENFVHIGTCWLSLKSLYLLWKVHLMGCICPRIWGDV